MSQTNAIILRVDPSKTEEFERFFEKEILPLWHKFKDEGKFISASLTLVQDGSDIRSGVKDYLLHVEVPSMAEHTAFDTHPDFTRVLPTGQGMQVEEPLVFLGETLFQV